MRLPEGLAGRRVLDLLCRAGKGAFKLADRVGDGGFVLACDPDAARIAQAENRRIAAAEAGEAWARRLAFVCGAPEDLRACGVEDASFDLVYVNASLNVARDFDAVLYEAARMLVDGGVFWIAGVFAQGEGPAVCDLAPASAGNVFSSARTFTQVEQAARRAGFRSCAFSGVSPVVPDGEDDVPEARTRASVAADARLTR